MILEVFEQVGYLGPATTTPTNLMNRKGLVYIADDTEFRYSIVDEWASDLLIYSPDFVLKEADVVKILNGNEVYWGNLRNVTNSNSQDTYEATFMYSIDMYLEEVFREEGYYIENDIVAWLQSQFEAAYVISGNDSNGTASTLYTKPSNGFVYATGVGPLSGTIIIPDRTLPISQVCKQMKNNGFKFECKLDPTNSFLISEVSMSANTDYADFNVTTEGLARLTTDFPLGSSTIIRVYLRKNADAAPEYHTTFYMHNDGTVSNTPILDKLLPPYTSTIEIYDWSGDDGVEAGQGQTWSEFVSASENDAITKLTQRSFNNRIEFTFKSGHYVYENIFFNDTSNRFDAVGKRGIINYNGIQINVLISGMIIKNDIVTIIFGLPNRRLF